jgi:hypothetical protein
LTRRAARSRWQEAASTSHRPYTGAASTAAAGHVEELQQAFGFCAQLVRCAVVGAAKASTQRTDVSVAAAPVRNVRPGGETRQWVRATQATRLRRLPVHAWAAVPSAVRRVRRACVQCGDRAGTVIFPTRVPDSPRRSHSVVKADRSYDAAERVGVVLMMVVVIIVCWKQQLVAMLVALLVALALD